MHNLINRDELSRALAECYAKSKQRLDLKSAGGTSDGFAQLSASMIFVIVEHLADRVERRLAGIEERLGGN